MTGITGLKDEINMNEKVSPSRFNSNKSKEIDSNILE